jgi:uncharacterized protein
MLDGVDPHCAAYKRIFDELNDRLNREMFDEPAPSIGFGLQSPQKMKKPGVMALIRTIVEK